MEKKQILAERLRKATYVIEVYENQKAFEAGENYSSGSGIAINHKGDLLTAAHVLTNRSRASPLTGKEVVIARNEENELRSYKVILAGIEVALPQALADPLFIDLAYLQPSPLRNKSDFVPVKREPSIPGTSVLMSGFPDEIEPPLSFHRFINYANPAFTNPSHQTGKKLKRIRQILMLKSGMIGSAQMLSIDDGKHYIYAYYIDNGMHSGSSGGGVINLNGDLIGIVTQRAVTTISDTQFHNPNIKVPSGSTLAISPSTLIEFLELKGFLPI